MLETMPHLTHERCAVLLETGEFEGHRSVTELEICADYYGAWEFEEMQAVEERYAEGAWLRYAEGGWDVTGEYLWDSLRVPGDGFGPQVA
jgi:hypothetical protein